MKARFVFMFVLVVLMFVTVLTVPISVYAHVDFDPGAGGYVKVMSIPTSLPEPTTQICTETVTVTHPCGHRIGASLGAACGDPTCGQADDPSYCGGISPCFYCCCGCSAGCEGRGRSIGTGTVVVDPPYNR